MRWCVIIAMAVLTGCQTTHPLNGAAISYSLPRTDAKLVADLTLRTCEDDAKITVDAQLSVTPIVGAQTDRYSISGEQLGSAHIKRSFKLTVNDSGVITGVNSDDQERSPEIVENVLKTAVTIAAIAGRPKVADLTTKPVETRLVCTPEVQNALQRSTWLKEEIASIRHDLVTTASRGDANLVKKLNSYATEKAALDTGILHIEVTAPIKLDTLSGDVATTDWAQAEVLPVDATAFDQWFGPARPKQTGEEHSARENLLKDLFAFRWAASAIPDQAPTAQPIPGAEKATRTCHFAIAVPAPREVSLVVRATGNAFPAGTEADQTIYAAQNQPANSLCLDLGFGETRTVALTFDDYGRTKEFDWGSDATGVARSGEIAGIASSTKDFRSALTGPSAIEAQQAEITRLQTLQQLNELRACQAIIEAGGYECPKPSN